MSGTRCQACGKALWLGTCPNRKCPLFDGIRVGERAAFYGGQSLPPPPPPPVEDPQAKAIAELRASLVQCMSRLQVVEQRLLELQAERRR